MTDRPMTSAELERLGAAIWGGHGWKSKAAIALDVNRKTISRWLAGGRAPDWAADKLRAMASIDLINNLLRAIQAEGAEAVPLTAVDTEPRYRLCGAYALEDALAIQAAWDKVDEHIEFAYSWSVTRPA